MTDPITAIREALAAGPAGGDWKLWTSNSWRRFPGVLEPVAQHDGHPDLHATPETFRFIEAVNPVAIQSLLDRLDAAETDARRLDWHEAHPQAIKRATGYKGAKDSWSYPTADGSRADAQTFREAIDAATKEQAK